MPPAGSKSRQLLVPGLTTLLMLAVLIGLGVWQLQRRAWKLGVLAQIDQAESAPAIPLPADPPPYAKVRVGGTLRPDLQVRYGSTVRELLSGSVIGSEVIEPLERPGQDPLLVDLGWVPTGQTVAPTGTEVEGYIRPPSQPGLFSAKDDPAEHRFFTLDPAPIAAALGLPHVAPFTLVAMGPVAPGVYPQPAGILPRPPNDHLNYALTWFGLALALVVVFAAYARKVLRS